MRSRSIASSLILLSACSGGGGTDVQDDKEPASGKLLKVTYLRFELEPQSRRWVAQYRVMISRSWRAKHGDSPNEPLGKLFRRGGRSPFLGEVPDAQMELLLRELNRKGIDKLVSTRPEDLDLVSIVQAEKDPSTAQVTRIITVGNDSSHRSYLLRANSSREETLKGFVDCEREVIKMAVAYTAQVTTISKPWEGEK